LAVGAVFISLAPLTWKRLKDAFAGRAALVLTPEALLDCVHSRAYAWKDIQGIFYNPPGLRGVASISIYMHDPFKRTVTLQLGMIAGKPAGLLEDLRAYHRENG
jgi:hypothetical protein